MKKIIFLALITLFFAGCEKEEEKDLNFLSIELMTEDNPSVFTKTIILFEDSDYLIKTNLDNYINSYPFDVLFGYDVIKEKVILDSENQDTLLMTDYLFHAKDSTYILAYHLENGCCLIFDKNDNKIISKIKMDEWGFSPAPLAGAGGRRFYIKNELFLETTDWIS
ncbi:MAG: hypothetical protein K9H49_15745 [Bacteroidales bacterium]|nr:hypothetical protein [Bacteroidales bacterium]MCF8391061.1 hypothetical protein [Bacteroidales bacterium]